jgi:D-alanyl-D-alanine carboxypeptidase
MMEMRTLYLLVGLFFLLVRGAGGDEWKPVICDSAKSYHGPKLHARPPASVFAEAAGSLDGSLDANTVARLEKALDRASTATKAPALTVAVGIPGKGLWSATRLGQTVAGETVPQAFYWASAGKAFTAVVVLQLVEEGKLKLDDKLARWFPEFPNAKVISLDHLLTHTSGLYSFQNDPTLRSQPGYKSPEILLAVAQAHGNAFCPGEYWAYCNTGYVLLASIVEQVEGQPFHAVVNRRIVDRLGLKHTRSLAPNSPVADSASRQT